LEQGVKKTGDPFSEVLEGNSWLEWRSLLQWSQKGQWSEPKVSQVLRVGAGQLGSHRTPDTTLRNLFRSFHCNKEVPQGLPTREGRG
jgi:hypothetical protein